MSEIEDVPLVEQSPMYLATVAKLALEDIQYYTRLECPKAVESSTKLFMESVEALITVTITREIL